jgi:hypothetical protein
MTNAFVERDGKEISRVSPSEKAFAGKLPGSDGIPVYF